MSSIGIANQDQEKAELRDQWERTDVDMQAEFVGFLEEDDESRALQFLAECPPEWVAFAQKCALVGLRQVVLDSME